MKVLLGRFKQSLGIPLLAVFIALTLGALVLKGSGAEPLVAYMALIKGAFAGPGAIGRTLEKSAPLIFSGLSILFAFKAGLFNIGAQGQLIFGALFAAVIGFGIKGIPVGLHIPLTLFGGAFAGCLYGAIQGALKAYSDAHEVITGIMLNYIAINLTDFLTAGPFKDSTQGNIIARTPLILESAKLPQLLGTPAGFFVAVLVAILIWFFFQKTPYGFEVRLLGTNPHAARYAGVNANRLIIVVMGVSGLLAALGGCIETMGVVHRFQPGFNQGLGFDGITTALLARLNPMGIIPAALLIGAMKAGASQMQFSANVTMEIVDVIQALILFFVAADQITCRLLGIRQEKRERMHLSIGWGKPV